MYHSYNTLTDSTVVGRDFAHRRTPRRVYDDNDDDRP
jgi:hypothetical protein